MIGNRVEEYLLFYDPYFRDSPTPSETRLIAFPKKAKSVLRFKTAALGQNAVTQPLAQI